MTAPEDGGVEVVDGIAVERAPGGGTLAARLDRPAWWRRWLPRATGALLFVASLALVLAAQRDVGLARDEVLYMHQGKVYAAWWTGAVTGEPVLTEEKIDAAWGAGRVDAGNGEHPPLLKTMFGLSHALLHDELGVASERTAYRAPTALLQAVLVVLVFAFTLAVWGYAEGVIAALLVLLLPRLFFHSQLACFDAPIATLWFATVVAYYRALASRLWCLGLGVVFGLALATKHNAIILPAVIVAHYAWVALWSRRRQWRGDRDRARDLLAAGRTRSRLALAVRLIGPTLRELAIGAARRRPLVFAGLIVVGPLTLFALWPRLWVHPGHVFDWIGFHLDHVHYNFEYLGDNWNAPPFPWHVALVTTLVTVPVVTLVAGGLGAGVLAARAWRGEAALPDRAPALLILLSFGASIGPFFLGSTPIFGAEKHWAPAIPSLCIAAGVGAVWAARRLGALVVERLAWARGRRGLVDGLAIAALGGALVAASAVETAASQPYGLTHYNALAGGAAGGADLGMNRQFWGVAAQGVLPWLRAQPPGKVYSHDASPAWGVYIKEGKLDAGHGDAGREDVGVGRSKYAIVVHELHFNRHDYMIWKAYGTVQPVLVLRAGGVPVVSVYRRP